MLEWLVVEADRRDLLGRAIARVWRGASAVIADLDLPHSKSHHALIFTWAEGTVTCRAARWPELLADWRDIYEEPLFEGDALPVLAEELSGLGPDVLIVQAQPGLRAATIAWYGKGALARYEHVGGATVAWSEEGGLGRPFDGSFSRLAAAGGKKVADLLGSGRDVSLMERIENTNRAVGEVLIERALFSLLGRDPPAIDELAGMVAQAPQRRLTPP